MNQPGPEPRSRRRWGWRHVVGAVLAVTVGVAAIGYANKCGEGGPYVDQGGKFTHVTVRSSFAHIAGHPAFSGFGAYIVPWESGFVSAITGPLAVEKLAPDLGAWNPGTMVEGVNFLIDQVNAGRTIYHPLYSDREIAESPGKRTAGLFFFPGKPNAPFALVMAGGGFTSVASIQEAFPHARLLHGLGYNVFVLKYRVGDHSGEAGGRDERIHRASEDVVRAMSFIRDRADDWRVDPVGYSIWGSSAGGYLAMQWGFDAPNGARANGFAPPAAIIAAYPGAGHAFGISGSFPPCFVTIAEDDELVPVAQVDRIVAQIKSFGVPVNYKKVHSGGHGFGLGKGTDAEGWLDEAVAFWEAHRH